MRLLSALTILLLLSFLSVGCDSQNPGHKDKISVITTIFPLYDFARNVGKEKVEVILLLPPGMEPHHFEPKPGDIVRINRADLFVYTNRYMEPWAADITGSIDTKKTLIVDAGRGVRLLKAGGPAEGAAHGGSHRHGEGGTDPHIWLDFGNAQIMVRNIMEGLIAKDPANRQYYTANAASYNKRLADLDRQYREGLSHCARKMFLHGGHYAFGYLADRYGLKYESAYALSADAEPTPARITALVRQMRENGLKYIFTEELLEPRVAETIARETGAGILKLHAAHNISREELAQGATFLSLMEQNLKNLRTGLECRQK
jgi:zinc transport system substrate-binding protein